ncbi:hypothetical protein AJ79_05561 [Helicocarpus griseus UAMH5409]|uniref:Transcriptional regulatory protein n=1 Tax=Helicocarpus griseus UAMH5409 TaxID=1447875 RepID=A0A2B7XLX1_9EURO|nr:hypothetical protein AJ79_05561 [Helicocarpus griseus UAMH5409]
MFRDVFAICATGRFQYVFKGCGPCWSFVSYFNLSQRCRRTAGSSVGPEPCWTSGLNAEILHRFSIFFSVSIVFPGPLRLEIVATTNFMASVLSPRLWGASRAARPWKCESCRTLSSSAFLQSGHNRWSTIKHDKGKNDRAKSKERALHVRDIIYASKLYGPDPDTNPRLALVISKAKRSAMPKDTIEAAIARGQGRSSTGAALEPITIEALLPPLSVAAVIECMTDQKLRTLQEVRYLIKHHGGTTTPTSYLFEKKGRIVFEKVEGLNVDDYLEQAIDAGALDVDTDEQGRLRVFTEHSDTKDVGDKLSDTTGLNIETSDIIWDPNKDTMVKLESQEDADKLEEILNVIRDDSSVQGIYTNSILG